jgi:bla regulator protein blaR1
MTAEYLSALWADIAPALGNHLWQSTLFATAAGLLTLALRKNHARVRYWLWLAASVKFLIPFSLLTAIGSHLPWSRGAAKTNAGLGFVIEQVGLPFAQPAPSAISHATPSIAFPSLMHPLPGLLAAAWICGFALVLLVWCGRWRRISGTMREGLPLRAGREVEALRRTERIQGIRGCIEILSSRTSLEPGIFGIARPVLVWPEGISERLDDAHLEAILTHEVRHVRRRDNLTAALHMVVEAVFWFHPLVWWLGGRLMEERERACDEEVLELGSERQVYAESILKVCEFCVGSPLACVSGVTGADLKKRIVNIMTERVVRKLDFSRKLLLSAAALVAVAAPIVFGLANATQSQAQSQAETAGAGAAAYKSASIKPSNSANGAFQPVAIMFGHDGFTARSATLQAVMQVAYGVQPNQISAAPEWVNSEKFDIDVRLGDSPAEGAPKAAGDIGIEQLRLMLQALLADRFKLTLHRETKELPVYELTVAEDGPKFQETKSGPGMMKMGRGELIDEGTTLEPLVEQLSMQLGRPVLDKTGLKGNYNFTLKWTPGEHESAMFNGAPDSRQSSENLSASESGSSILAAVQEQLGLKLESQTSPIGVLVIDHVEKPAEN